MVTICLVNRKKVEINRLIFFIFFCMVIFLYFSVLPLYAQMGEAENMLAAKKADLARITSFLNVHSDLAAYEDEVRRKLAMVNRRLPDEEDLPLLMNELEKAAVLSGVCVLDMKQLRADDLAVDGEISLMLNLKGDYWQVMRFFYHLERLDRFKALQKWTVKKEKEEDILWTELTFSIFYREGKMSQKQENHVEVSNLIG